MAAPIITSNGGGSSASITIDENIKSVTIVTATDADPATTLTYSILGGADASKFKIDPVTGVLTFVGPPDFENPTDAGGNNIYDVQVQVSDGSLVDTQTIAVTIANVTPAVITGTGGADIIDATHTPVGEDFVTSEGDTINALGGNDFIDGGLGGDTMNGGLGNDTFVVESAGDVVLEASGVGTGTDTVLSSITYTLGANVENLTLTGSGLINATGNGLDNVIIGNSASNKINGGLGADDMSGGGGSDTYTVDDAGDLVTEGASAGTDTVLSSVDFTLGANVENLTLTGSTAVNGTGNSLNNTIIGNGLDNLLIGAGGIDHLTGGVGADEMRGGAGNDVYNVDNVNDLVVETLGNGTDTVLSSVSLTLGSNVENLTLTGSAGNSGTGNGLDNVIIGNLGANALSGGDGNDTLNGGNGNDTMTGGDGNDSFFVNAAGDVVTEDSTVGSGTDTINSSITFDLGVNGINVENLTLTGVSAIDGTGSDVANVLTGNTGANTLTGLGGGDTLNGGRGADNLIGGAGSDTYIVDNAGDVVTELVSQGVDTVNASVSYTLASFVEKLTLTGGSAINGTGNSGANILTGNSAANVLTGMGGADDFHGGGGNDTLIGGSLDDWFWGDAGADTITGGAADDIFYYTAITDSGTTGTTRDTITDLTETDIIDVSAIDANTGTIGDDAFTVDLDASFSTGEIMFTVVGSDVLISFNNDADAAADMQIMITGGASLVSFTFDL